MKKIIILCFIFIYSFQLQSVETAKFARDFNLKQYEAFAKKFMISTQGPYTSKAAKLMFEKGGNIYDAFLAATLTISVERPHSTGLGGGGFAVIYQAQEKKFYAFDFRERAPLKAQSNLFLNAKGEVIPDKSTTGIFSAAVPGLVKGAMQIHEKWGKLPREVVFAPAIDLAEKGFLIYPALAQALDEEQARLLQFPSTQKIFFKKKKILKEGERLIQKDLAQTLKKIKKDGSAAFYEGDIAKKIISTSNLYQGLLTEQDLKNYKVIEREPIIGVYRGHKIISMPPPSSGGVHIIQILNILENFDLKKWGIHSFKAIHAMSSAMQMAFADRAQYLGDPDFVKVPVLDIINKEYAKKLANKINFKKALQSKDFPQSFKQVYESPETTHFSLMDHENNVIVSTQTINGWFGSGLVVEGTGIILNNEMDDFATQVGASNMFGAIGGKNNLIEPFKTPLSSMSPTIVMKNDEPLLALGTPSGTRILTCVMQTIVNFLDFELPLFDAVAAKRFHHQWYPERIHFEEPMNKKLETQLIKIGHKLHHEPLWCKIQAIRKEGTILHGVSDPREEGMSVGL